VLMDLYEQAAMKGCVRILDYLYQMTHKPLSHHEVQRLVNHAADCGTVETLEWLAAHFVHYDFDYDRIANYAVTTADHPVQVLRWAHQQGHAFTAATVHRAIGSYAQSGSLEALKYLHEINAPWMASGESVKMALVRGHTEKLIWLRSIGCEWGNNPLSGCSRHTEVYQWALANGAPPRRRDRLHGGLLLHPTEAPIGHGHAPEPAYADSEYGSYDEEDEYYDSDEEVCHCPECQAANDFF